MTMSVGSLSESHKLFNCQKRDDSSQYPQTNYHILHVVMSMFMAIAMVFVAVTMVFVAVGVVSHMIVFSVMMVFSVVTVRGNSMGNEMQESITQEAPRSETQENLEKSRVLLGIPEWYVKQDKERGSTNEQS